MGVIHEYANTLWREMRDEYERYLQSQYDKALEECSGVLLNRTGIAEGVSSESLFKGTWPRAKKYASEELLTWWETNSRLSSSEFEEQWFNALWSGE